MFAIVICLVLLMCTLTIRSSVLCVLIVECMSVVVNVMLSLMSVMSPPPALRNLSVYQVMNFGCFGFRGELGFLKCDDVCMCVVNKPYELLEFVFYSVYVDLQFSQFYFWLCVLGLSMRLSWYPMHVDEMVAVNVMRVLSFVLHVCLLRECDGVGDG